MQTLRINEMKCIGPHDLLLRFSNGYAAEVNLTRLLYGPVFIPLRDPDYFSQVKLNSEAGTIYWPNGADFAPETLYKMAKALTDLRSELLAGFQPETQGGLFPDIEVKTKKTGSHQAARFVTQLHRAKSLHYDFRFELSGQLISWVIETGPSLRAGERRAAKRVDDHGMRALEPIGERLIAPGRYGAGPILMVLGQFLCGTLESILCEAQLGESLL